MRNKLDELFSQYDILLAPACSKKSYEKAELSPITSVYEESVYTALASVTGIPAVVTGGVQLIADNFNESLLLSAAAKTEVE